MSFAKIVTKHNRIRVIFTGAGTSAYVGDTVTPYVIEKVDEQQWEVLSIPTTTLVSNPYQFFKRIFQPYSFHLLEAGTAQKVSLPYN